MALGYINFDGWEVTGLCPYIFFGVYSLGPSVMARGSIRGLVDPTVSLVRLSINFDDDGHRVILGFERFISGISKLRGWL